MELQMILTEMNQPSEHAVQTNYKHTQALQLHLGMTSVLFFKVTNQQPADRQNLQQSNEFILYFYYLLPKKEMHLHPKKHIHQQHSGRGMPTISTLGLTRDSPH